MKLELPVSAPEGVNEAWEGQFRIFSWYHFIVNVPSPVFIVTTLKKNGLANAQLSAWGMMVGGGKEPKFLLQVYNRTETKMLIESTGEFVVNYPSIELREDFLKTTRPFDDNTDEVLASGLNHEAAVVVKTPRVKECFAHLECRLDWIRDIETTGTNSLVQASIVHASISANVLAGDARTTHQRRRLAYRIQEIVNPLSGKHSTGGFAALNFQGDFALD